MLGKSIVQIVTPCGSGIALNLEDSIIQIALLLAMTLGANEPTGSRDVSWSLPTATWTVSIRHLDDWLPLIPDAMDLLVVDVSLNGKATKALCQRPTSSWPRDVRSTLERVIIIYSRSSPKEVGETPSLPRGKHSLP